MPIIYSYSSSFQKPQAVHHHHSLHSDALDASKSRATGTWPRNTAHLKGTRSRWTWWTFNVGGLMWFNSSFSCDLRYKFVCVKTVWIGFRRDLSSRADWFRAWLAWRAEKATTCVCFWMLKRSQGQFAWGLERDFNQKKRKAHSRDLDLLGILPQKTNIIPQMLFIKRQKSKPRERTVKQNVGTLPALSQWVTNNQGTWVGFVGSWLRSRP